MSLPIHNASTMSGPTRIMHHHHQQLPMRVMYHQQQQQALPPPPLLPLPTAVPQLALPHMHPPVASSVGGISGVGRLSVPLPAMYHLMTQITTHTTAHHTSPHQQQPQPPLLTHSHQPLLPHQSCLTHPCHHQHHSSSSSSSHHDHRSGSNGGASDHHQLHAYLHHQSVQAQATAQAHAVWAAAQQQMAANAASGGGNRFSSAGTGSSPLLPSHVAVPFTATTTLAFTPAASSATAVAVPVTSHATPFIGVPPPFPSHSSSVSQMLPTTPPLALGSAWHQQQQIASLQVSLHQQQVTAAVAAAHAQRVAEERAHHEQISRVLQASMEHAQPTPSRGASAAAIAALKSAKVTPESLLTHPQCTICLSEFEVTPEEDPVVDVEEATSVSMVDSNDKTSSSTSDSSSSSPSPTSTSSSYEHVFMPCSPDEKFCHAFHRDCIRTWLQMRNSCPCCRREVPMKDENEEKKEREARQSEIPPPTVNAPTPVPPPSVPVVVVENLDRSISSSPLSRSGASHHEHKDGDADMLDDEDADFDEDDENDDEDAHSGAQLSAASSTASSQIGRSSGFGFNIGSNNTNGNAVHRGGIGSSLINFSLPHQSNGFSSASSPSLSTTHTRQSSFGSMDSNMIIHPSSSVTASPSSSLSFTQASPPTSSSPSPLELQYHTLHHLQSLAAAEFSALAQQAARQQQQQQALIYYQQQLWQAQRSLQAALLRPNENGTGGGSHGMLPHHSPMQHQQQAQHLPFHLPAPQVPQLHVQQQSFPLSLPFTMPQPSFSLQSSPISSLHSSPMQHQLQIQLPSMQPPLPTLPPQSMIQQQQQQQQHHYQPPPPLTLPEVNLSAPSTPVEYIPSSSSLLTQQQQQYTSPPPLLQSTQAPSSSSAAPSSNLSHPVHHTSLCSLCVSSDLSTIHSPNCVLSCGHNYHISCWSNYLLQRQAARGVGSSSGIGGSATSIALHLTTSPTSAQLACCPQCTPGSMPRQIIPPPATTAASVTTSMSLQQHQSSSVAPLIIHQRPNQTIFQSIQPQQFIQQQQQQQQQQMVRTHTTSANHNTDVQMS